MPKAQDISIKTIMLDLQAKGFKVQFEFWPRVVTLTDKITKKKYEYSSLVEAYRSHQNQNNGLL
jgi:hypothetical protein